MRRFTRKLRPNLPPPSPCPSPGFLCRAAGARSEAGPGRGWWRGHVTGHVSAAQNQPSEDRAATC
eukprot:3482642-Rhodomonas_salina.1